MARIRLRLDPDGKYYVPAAGFMVETATGLTRYGWAYGGGQTRAHIPYRGDVTGFEVASLISEERELQVAAVTLWLGQNFILSDDQKSWTYEWTMPDVLPDPPAPPQQREQAGGI